MFKRRNKELFLAEDVIFNILVRVPAQDICNAAIFVCRTWSRMIRTRVFFHAHLQQSTPGLLVLQDGSQPIFLVTRKGQIEKSIFYCKFTREILSSCNGLVLKPRDENCFHLYITNPSTKQYFALPSFQRYPYPKPQCCAIAYAAADKKYKVVRFFFSEPDRIECAILTVRVDSDWGRRVNTQHLPLADKFLISKQSTLTTQGFVHLTDSMCSDFLSLNVETEVITQFSVPAAALRPDDGSGLGCLYYYLAMGSNLSLLVRHSSGWLSWEAWEMRPETGEWTQMPSIIDLEPHQNHVLSSSNCRLGFSMCRFEPVGWLSVREVLVFCVYPEVYKSFHIAYNVRTQEIVSTELGLHVGSSYFLAHKNTLLWL